MVLHPDHRTLDSARTMVHGYVKGVGSALTSSAIRHPRLLGTLLVQLPRAVAHALSPNSSKNAGRPADYPRHLIWAEITGMVVGPIAYLLSRADVRTHRRNHQVASTPISFDKGMAT